MITYLVTARDDLGQFVQCEELTEQSANQHALRWADAYSDVTIWKRHAVAERTTTYAIKPVKED